MLKGGLQGEVGSDCSHDVVSSKPVTGRDMTDVVWSEVTSCGNKRCMTCTHIVIGSTFRSKIVYIVSCILDFIYRGKCGILRSRLNE